MKVLHLTVSANRGGRRDAIESLIQHSRPLGVECGVVALRNSTAEMSELARHASYARGMGLTTRPTLRQLREIRHYCREHGVQLVHAHDAGSQYVAAMLHLVSPTLRAVMTFHRTLGTDSEGMTNRIRNSLLLTLVNGVLTASEERRKYFISNTLIRPSKVRVIPLGVDLERYHPDHSGRAQLRRELGLHSDTLLLVAVGHFGPEKGIDQVIAGVAAAAPQLGSRPWHLVVVGGGEAERLEQLREAARQSIPGRVTFTGFRSDVPRWFQAADLCVHAPRMEAFGLVVVQAMACGLPVVGTAVGGVPEIVESGTSGTLVPAGDIGALGQAIAATLEDPGERDRLALGALARARSHFDARQTAARHVNFYRELLRER